MNVEPQLIKSIKRSRRGVLLVKSLFVGFLTVVVLAELALIVIWFATGRTSLGELNAKMTSFGTMAAFAFPVIVVLTGLLCADIQYDSLRARFRAAPGTVSKHDRSSFRKFENAARAVSIGAGIAPPRVEVMDIPTVNAMSYIDYQGGVHVGVTRDMLGADLTSGEVEAIIGHEISHLIIGDNVKPPGMTWFWCAVIAFLFPALGTVFVLTPDTVFQSPPGFFILMLVICSPWYSLFPLEKPFERLMISYRHHDDLLADSLAVQITRDPDALVSAIRRVDAGMDDYSGESGFASIAGAMRFGDYLFVIPHPAPERYHRQVARRVRRNISPDIADIKKMIKTEIRQLARIHRWETEFVSDRISNLETIAN